VANPRDVTRSPLGLRRQRLPAHHGRHPTRTQRGGVGERFVATVAAEWTTRIRAGDPRVPDATGRLHAALYGRVLGPLRGWLGEPDLKLELEMAAADGAASLARDGDAVRAIVPFRWLVDVWARSLPVVQGRFCLSAETADGHEWALQTIAPDLRTLERIELRIGD
jgi:hypothetical protein